MILLCSKSWNAKTWTPNTLKWNSNLGTSFFLGAALLFWGSGEPSSCIKAWTDSFFGEACDTEGVRQILICKITCLCLEQHEEFHLYKFYLFMLFCAFLLIYEFHFSEPSGYFFIYLFAIYDFPYPGTDAILINMFFSVQKIFIPPN